MTESATAEPPVPHVTIRPARKTDVRRLLILLQPFVEQQRLLPRTRDELLTQLPNSFVAAVGRELVGFAVLEVYSKKLAEIRSLAVKEDYQRQGIGKQLVDACVQRARDRNILEVMAITSSERFFHACGFDFTLPGEKKALFLHTRDEP